MHCVGERNSRNNYRCTSSDDDVTDRMSCATNSDWRQVHRSAMVQLMGGVYGLAVVMLGLVFSLAAAVTYGQRTNLGQNSFYLEVFQIYIYGLCLAFLAYVHAHLLRSRPQTTMTTMTTTAAEAEAATVTDKLDADEEEKCAEKINLEELDSSGVEKNCKDEDSKPVPTTDAADHRDEIRTHYRRETVTFDGKDVNFYLRLGTIVFGTASMVQDGFRLAQLLQDGRLSFRCLGPLNIVVVALHITFIFFQTFYLFKSHKIVVHRQKGAVRLGFIHMIAANLSVAILTTVNEIHSDIIVTGGKSPNSSSSSSSSSTVSNATCVPEENLSWKASPYLYPCTIQYSIVAAAIIYQMHRNISSTHARPVEETHVLTEDSASTCIRQEAGDVAPTRPGQQQQQQQQWQPTAAVDCEKAHKGLFLGLLVLVSTLVATSCFFVFATGSNYFYSARDAIYYSEFIFFFTELALLVFSSSAVVVGFAKFRSLRFSPSAGDLLETSLLIFALSGIIAMECFRAVSSVTSVGGPENVVGILSVCTSAALLVQVFLQTVFVVDTLRRSVSNAVQQQRKPGRALVTFLLLCNVSLLVLSMFEVKKYENLHIHSLFYGYLAWSVISHVTGPIHIFYRFHSVVCLSNIWNNVYKVKDK